MRVRLPAMPAPDPRERQASSFEGASGGAYNVVVDATLFVPATPLFMGRSHLGHRFVSG